MHSKQLQIEQLLRHEAKQWLHAEHLVKLQLGFQWCMTKSNTDSSFMARGKKISLTYLLQPLEQGCWKQPLGPLQLPHPPHLAMCQRNPHWPWFQSHPCWETWDQLQLWRTPRLACWDRAAFTKQDLGQHIKLSMSKLVAGCRRLLMLFCQCRKPMQCLEETYRKLKCQCSALSRPKESESAIAVP